MLKRLVFALVAILTLSTSLAQAAPVCADLFRTPAKNPLAKIIRSNALTKSFADEVSSLIRRLRAPKIQIERFDFALDFYRRYGIEGVGRPRTPESRLAYLHYVVSTRGRNPYDLEAWARQASPAEFKALVKSIGSFNSDKGFSPAQIDSIYWKLMMYSASSPNSIRNLRRLGVTQMDRIALEQWTMKEIASQNAVKAFKNLGLLRDPKARRRMMDLLRTHPNVTTNLVAGSLMVLEKHLLGSPLTAPSYSRLRVTKLAASLAGLVEKEGFNAIYPILKERYGHLARFDRGFYFANRAMTVGLMTYWLAHLVPTIVAGVIPPNLVTSDMNAVQITEAVVRYYSDLSAAIISDRMDGTDDQELSVRAQSEKQGSMPAAPRPPIASPGTVKAPPPIDLNKVSANRVMVTFDQQIAKDKKVPVKLKAPPKTDLGTAEQSAKALNDNLDYLNSLDFSDQNAH